jgi:hypothetical protein
MNQAYDIGKFTTQTVMRLHTFQKKYENTPGFSKADCIIGPKTIQQLLHDTGNNELYDGITGTAGVSVDGNFGVANIYANREFADITTMRATFEAIVKDNRIHNADKLSTLITLYKK